MAAPLRGPQATRTDAEPRPAFRKRRPYRSDQTVGAMLIAFLVAVLLGSQSLVELAAQQPFGTRRTILLGTARGVDRFAHALSLDRPARIVNGWTGKVPQEQIDVEALIEQQQAGAPPTPSTIPLDVNPETGMRYVTPAEPLRVLLAGDSMMRELGASIEDVASPELTDITLDYRVSSGLSRPDFFDWPSHLAQLLVEDRPEAVVLLFGTNDDQNVEVDGKVLTARSPEWMAEYRRRVGVVMDLLDRPGLTVTWVTLPAMRSADFSGAMSALSDVYRSEAQHRPWVHVVDGGAAIEGPGGAYATHLPGGDGSDVLMRQEDGVHLSRPGADRATVAIWDDVVQRWDLDGAEADLAGPAASTTSAAG